MAFIYALDPTAPANTDLVKDGAADMRLIKNALIERVQSFFQNVDSDPWVAKAGVTFAGNFTQSAGTASLQAVTATTVTATSHVAAGAAANLRWTGRAILTSPADGQILATDNAGTAFTRMMFGGTTSSYPAITRSAAALHFKLADDSAFANVQALAGTFGNTVTVTAGGITVTGNSTITGTLGGVTTFTVTTVTATNLGGTLSTAAQPNVTSVGTLTSLTVTVGVDSIVLNGSPTNGPQIKLGNSSVFGAVGSRYSNGNSFLSSNAYQTTTGVDSWTQSSAGFKSVLFDLDYASGIRLLSANAGAAVANFATFWGSAVFTVTNAGVGTFAAGLNVNAGTAAVQALTATTGTFTSTVSSTIASGSAAFVMNSGARFYLDGGSDTFIYESAGNIVEVVTGGAFRFLVSTTAIAIPAANKLFLDGGTDTYIYEVSANKIAFVGAGTTGFTVEDTRVSIPATAKFYLDGIGDTYISETSANTVEIFAGGTSEWFVNTNGAGLSTATKKLFVDGGGDTYLVEAAANQLDFYSGGTRTLTLLNGDISFINTITLGLAVASANVNYDVSVSNKLYYVTSSRKIKRDIQTITLEQAQFIFKTRPVTFRSALEGADDTVYAGFISEEMLALNRIFVSDPDGEYPGVNYDRLVAPLTVIVTDHETRIKKLESLQPVVN